jgi:asparagine synthase (glutamine-hydrolysing)
MPGFFLEIYAPKGENYKYKTASLINETIFGEDYYARRSTINKFINDKVFYKSEKYLIILEGVIFNKNELIIKFSKDNSWINCLIEMYNLLGDDFFNEFRGSFSGVFFEKNRNKYIVFVDQIGSKQLYHSKIGNKIIISSEIKWITNYFNENAIPYSLDEQGSALLLTYGFMLEDITIIKEVRKLNAGFKLVISNYIKSEEQYFLLENIPDNNTTEEEFIEQIDELFLSAVRDQFEKNKEYNYDNYNTLSGGLDSRMTTFAAHRLGYKNIINITWSQSSTLDETLAKKISEDLNYEWLFKSLDNGLFLNNIDGITEINGGIALNYGHAHQYSIYRLLKKDKIGILHTGQLGDVVVGTFYEEKKSNLTYKIGDGAYSNRELSILDDLKLKVDYRNQEIFNFYNRGFTGANSGLVISQEFTEPFSPFYQLDFLEKCLTIPVEMRYNHKFYMKWIISKYPEASIYPWERTNNLITSKRYTIKGKSFYPNQIFSLIKRKVLRIKENINDPKARFNNMNPIDFYYHSNDELKSYWDTYFKDNCELLPEKILPNALNLYENGNAVEKNMVLSLLSAIKYFFTEE